LREVQVPPSGWRLAELQHVREALSLSELPPIRLCRRARMPMVAGLRHPRVILPQALATEMTPAEFTDTLIHECAHIRRRDQWVLALQRVALVAFWPHPLLHYLSRELERAREELCDNYVLTASRPSAYAETLLRLAQVCLPAPKWGSSMAMLGGRTPLEERIRRLVDKRRERNVALNRCSRIGLALLMTLLVAGISGVQLHLRAAPRPADPALSPGASLTGTPATDPSAAEIEKKVVELTRDWSSLRLFEDVETWAAQIQELVQIGRPTVPALTALLDRTEADLPLRLLGFTLRAIGDPRAVPALIRAIPRTLRPPGSDCGVLLNDGELKEFMFEHHLSGPKERRWLDLGRPVREICAALQKTTGTILGEEEAYYTFLEGEDHQRDLQRQLYDRIAHRWADWWGTNWNRLVADPALVSVALPSLIFSGQAGPGKFPTGPAVKVSGGTSNVGISPVEKPGGCCFLDLDTSRHPAWPKALGDSADTGDREALWAWAAQEGVDLAAVTYRAPGADKDYYGLKAVGLQAWEIPNERWYTVAEEVRQDLPLELGRPAGEFLIHYDSQEGRYVPNRRATFLFITREGTPGILRLTTQVLPPGERLAQPDPSAKSDPVAAFRNRYGLSTPATDLSSNQKEEEAGLEPIGVKIEYKFFVRGSGD
jgi:hypothetical protein